LYTSSHISFFFFICYAYHSNLHSFLHDALPILSDHYGAASITDRFLEPIDVRSERRNRDVDENGHESVLENRIDGRRETRFSKTDRKSTRLNSSHLGISYAVFCLKKKKKKSIRQ